MLHERFDNFLRKRYPAVTRSALQRLIEEGHIRVNGQIVKPTHTPHGGEEIQVHWPEGNVIVRRGITDPGGGVPDYNATVGVEKRWEINL